MGKRTGHANGPIAPWKARRQEGRRKAADERTALYRALPLAEQMRRNPNKFTTEKDSNGVTTIYRIGKAGNNKVKVTK